MGSGPGCALCIVGSVIIALNSPEQQSVTKIRDFEKLFIAPGFLVWAGLLITAAIFSIFFLVPRYGKKTMLVHIGELVLRHAGLWTVHLNARRLY